MVESDLEDSLTTINTALNKSMVLMDSPDESESKPRGTKVIKINTKAQPPNVPETTPSKTRKSILKKPNERAPEVSESQDNSTDAMILNNDSMVESSRPTVTHVPRPHSLADFVKDDTVIEDSTSCTFTLDDLSDSEELWVMDIPKTINPKKLKGQTLMLGQKSKLKIDDDRYYAISRPNNGSCLTGIFSTGREKSPYKVVNIKPAGTISIRRKLRGVSIPDTLDLEPTVTPAVPFPSNLKVRHPFFGANINVEKST